MNTMMMFYLQKLCFTWKLETHNSILFWSDILFVIFQGIWATTAQLNQTIFTLYE